ncbi:hypothetical protein BJY24_004148 [Nocardia transvalensis]|uniref:DUF3168 domain-containing protein n=1 Tax=Nocardia transvalensis TaxID=37333 RepID=A0A7W9PFK5_9NOCA|nr:hypothetical protein [Nocardia transvalensis]MBB5915281.1 hypothetical protein [Nocardia transvalensis]
MKPFRLPADPAKTAKNYLAAVLPALVATPAPTFGMVLPSQWTPSKVPAVVVFDDSGPNTWPVSTRPTLRITVWADGRDRARQIAGAALGVLLAHRIPGIASITNPTNLLEAVDSNNGGITVSFTVSAQARTLAG